MRRSQLGSTASMLVNRQIKIKKNKKKRLERTICKGKVTGNKAGPLQETTFRQQLSDGRQIITD